MKDKKNMIFAQFRRKETEVRTALIRNTVRPSIENYTDLVLKIGEIKALKELIQRKWMGEPETDIFALANEAIIKFQKEDP